MDEYQLSIITPEGQVFHGPVTSVIAPGALGSFGVLANHAPFVSSLKAGVMEVIGPGERKFYVVTSGILEVESTGNVLILADNAHAANSRDDALMKLSELVTS